MRRTRSERMGPKQMGKGDIRRPICQLENARRSAQSSRSENTTRRRERTHGTCPRCRPRSRPLRFAINRRYHISLHSSKSTTDLEEVRGRTVVIQARPDRRRSRLLQRLVTPSRLYEPLLAFQRFPLLLRHASRLPPLLHRLAHDGHILQEGGDERQRGRAVEHRVVRDKDGRRVVVQERGEDAGSEVAAYCSVGFCGRGRSKEIQRDRRGWEWTAAGEVNWDTPYPSTSTMSELNTLAVSSDVQARWGGELKVYPGRDGTTTS